MRPILLLDMRIVVLVVGTRTGEGRLDWILGKITQQAVIEKLAAIVAIESRNWKGKVFSIVLICSRTPLEPLFQVARHSVHPVRISVRLRLQTKSPASELPQCATVSASMKPGSVISQCMVRIGI